MTAPKSNHETDFTAQAKNNAVPESIVAPSEGAKKSEAHLRKIIDTIPTLAWCNLPDGCNEFVNQRPDHPISGEQTCY